MKLMRIILIPFVVATFINERQPRACAGNSCNRAVTGLAKGSQSLLSRLADCSSFLSATIYPQTITVTASSTIIGPPAGSSEASILNTEKTVTPTSIPSYAKSACSDSNQPLPVRYASACSCAGVTRMTTTLPTPTITTMVVISQTTSSFYVIATATSGSTYYLADPSTDFVTQEAHQLSFTKNFELATPLQLVPGLPGPALGIGISGFIGSQGMDQFTSPVFFNPEAAIARGMGVNLVFTVHSDFSLTGVNGRTSVSQFGNCSGTFSTVDSNSPRADCEVMTFSVVYL